MERFNLYGMIPGGIKTLSGFFIVNAKTKLDFDFTVYNMGVKRYCFLNCFR